LFFKLFGKIQLCFPILRKLARVSWLLLCAVLKAIVICKSKKNLFRIICNAVKYVESVILCFFALELFVFDVLGRVDPIVAINSIKTVWLNYIF
jgi:hypothetical protein